MKKLLWILGAFFFAFLVAIVSIPLFVDVDQYRPTIVAEANKRINGKLELGKLKLGLWGAIKIHAESIKLSVNGFPEPMLDTKQFHVEIPFFSLLSGTPQVIAVLESPKISVVKNEAGKMNAMELMKTAEASAPTAPAPQQSAAVVDTVAATSAAPAKKAAAPAAPSALPAEPKAAPVPAVTAEATAPSAAPAAPAEPMKVPALVAGAKVGLRIREGDLRYSDKLAKADYQVIGLDLDARNLGLGSTMNISLKAPLKGSTPTLSFSGPVTAEAELSPVLVGSAVRSVRGRLELNATGLQAEMKGGAFRKPEGMPLKVSAQLDGNEQETLLRALDVVFADFKIHGKGRVVVQPALSAKLNLGSDPGTVRLEKVQGFVPLAEPYQLKGVADFSADIDWRPEALKLSGDVKVSEGAFFLKDVLKAPMGFLVQAGFSESSLNLTRAALSGPETEVELRGSVKNFLAPQFSFALTGKSFNVDKALVLPAAQAKTASLQTLFIPVAHAAPAGDTNPLLALAQNPIVAQAAGTLTAQVAKVIVYGASLEQVSARAALQAMSLKVQEASLRTFGGTVRANAQAELKSPGLGFSTVGSVDGLAAKEALKAYFPKYERTLEGTVNGSWNISGAAYPAAARIRSLKGTAKVLAKDGVLKSVDVQESINSAMAKIPFLKNQKPVKVDNGFKTLTADLKFDGGVIRAEPIEVQPRNQGFVVKGKSTIQESLEQETFLDVYDPQGQLPKELQNPGKPAIPLRIYGSIFSPQTDINYTLSRVASHAGKNVLKDQALKALGVDNSPGKSDQQKLKEAADKLRKQFGF